MKKIRIRVTQKDIDEGADCSPDFCPIALSLKRRGFGRVQVGTTGWFPTARVEYPLPSDAAYFITAFDEGHPVEPCWFTLEYR